MTREDAHLSDRMLLLAADGELTGREAARVAAHLAGCWSCRARQQEIGTAAVDFIRQYAKSFEGRIPRAEGARALLRARLAEMAGSGQTGYFLRLRDAARRFSWAMAAAACVVIAVYAALAFRAQQRIDAATVTVPDRSLTPGAILLIGTEEVCRASNNKNKLAPVALQRKVFEEYGIRTAEARAYEMDYLITPALGGADDIRNVWPESYSSTVWNARVKDALEDHLRDMVCAGELDLNTAQRDIAVNWIEAYKKYFHTDRPLDPGDR